ncbi:unnamed protein product [Rotaria magnacalcarata]|uniref:Uncharacterized protein n=1 Tax=Rotaria magnacalcarata TaxID=392030 RepID=A0A820F530_9BILA|nr:unnamed protein product [Rotaria magnacalcarata]CAF4258687.1 unnamed protein product [Rotaria magnacalcarata]CAF4261024.1 unnamed protein product [Rotaria magnacalcarata]
MSSFIHEDDTERCLQLLESLNKIPASIEIVHSNQMNFNQYFQSNTDHINEIFCSLLLMTDKTYLNLSLHQDFSTISLKSSEIQLFAIHDNFIVYYDNYKSSSSLCGLNLQPYLEHKNAKQS